MPSTATPALALDPDTRGYRDYRNAVERHWDPHDIDAAADRERLVDLDDRAFAILRRPSCSSTRTRRRSPRISRPSRSSSTM